MEKHFVLRTWGLCQSLSLRAHHTFKTIYCRNFQFQKCYQSIYKSSNLRNSTKNLSLTASKLHVYNNEGSCFCFPSHSVTSNIKSIQFDPMIVQRHFFSSSTNVSKPKKEVFTKRDKTNSKIKPTVLSVKSTGVVNRLAFDENDWEVVYRFGSIRIARFIRRLKLFQTALTCCIILPGSIGLYLTDQLPVLQLNFVLGISTLACVMLYVMGTMCSRLIGAIYVSKTDSSMIRVGHMNFWGKREDQIFNRNEIIPFSELPDNVSDIYVNIKFYSDPDTKLHLSLRYGVVYDMMQFEEIFGKIS